MKIEGTIGHIRFHNEENGYTVASFFVELEDRKKFPPELNVLESMITIVGIFDRKPIEEEEFILEGEFINDKKFGIQFKFNKFERKKINSYLGIINFLSSDLFPGIGVAKATLIVDNLGLNALDLIRKDNSVLDNLKLSNEQKKTIINVLKQDLNNEKNLLFLLNNGISLTYAKKIISKFDGEDLIELISTNPYLLIDKIERFGFRKADQLALNLGLAANDSNRLRALINYILQEYIYGSGNSYIYINELYDESKKYLEEPIDYNDFNEYLKILHNEHKIFLDSNDRIFDYSLYQSTMDLAADIKTFIKDDQDITKYTDDEIDKAFNQITKTNKFNFSEEQIQAIKKAFTSRMVIITGGPGTGKTTIIHAVIKMFIILNHNNNLIADYVSLLAPTGRASKRLSEATSMPASTIHKYLGYDGEGNFSLGKYNKSKSRLIIIDEASMMDTFLASRLFSSCDKFARIIIVGDVDQLPSVGPGQVLKDLIDTSLIPTIYLKTIFRQANDSNIINLAHSINQGTLPKDLFEKYDDRRFIKTTDDVLAKLICDLYTKIIEKGINNKNIQILIPIYRGDVGINNINQLIQNAVNPKKDGEVELNINNHIYRIGDKVIQLVNRADKGIMNGDIGYITSILFDNNKPKQISVSFDMLKVDYEIDELEDITLAYAISIHKAQGSEFDYVIMPLSTKYYVMLKRKLIYTGVTRAKKVLFMIGNPNSLSSGIRRIEDNRRTILKEKILEYFNSKNRDEDNLKEVINKLRKIKEKKSIIDEEIEIGDEYEL